MLSLNRAVRVLTLHGIVTKIYPKKPKDENNQPRALRENEKPTEFGVNIQGNGYEEYVTLGVVECEMFGVGMEVAAQFEAQEWTDRQSGHVTLRCGRLIGVRYYDDQGKLSDKKPLVTVPPPA